MKKYVLGLVVLISILLTGCATETINENLVELPSLRGFTRTEIETELDALNIEYTFTFFEIDVDVDGYFSKYIDYSATDEFDITTPLTVEIYHYESETDDVEIDDEDYDDVVIDDNDEISEFFSPLEMIYTGPYLDESFSSIDYLNPRGGYFEVTVKYCTDGDTAVFNYPTDVYNAIESNAKSVRFLNMDTEETYSGGEEEWGKPASVYTCSLINAAESIMIQTDPGDALLGTYGRLLGWVWIKLPNEDEYFLLNYIVVKQGLAQVKYEFGAGETISYGDYTYNAWMHQAEDFAKANNLGQWSDLLDYYWDYENDEPYDSRW